jgi:hypothetical protein
MPLTMLIWPLPALLTWALAWAVFVGLRAAGLGAVAAFVLALLVSGVPAWTGRTPWRRAFMLGGFPLSLLATGAAGALPGWIWLVPLALLLALYPLNTWRDAPLFPTPGSALKGLARAAPLARGRSEGAARRIPPGAHPGSRMELAADGPVRLALPFCPGAPGRYLGCGLVGLRPGLSVPASGEHAARDGQGGQGVAAGELAGQSGV